MVNFFKVAVLFLILSLFTFCSKDENVKVAEEVASKPPVTGIRIAWDYTTLKKVSAGTTGYNGYARLIQLHDQTLICVYEADGNIVAVKSVDLGASWSAPVTVAAKEEGVNMSVPDILQLNDYSILVGFNPRPYVKGQGKRFGIRTIKSYDGGVTWKDEKLLYEAGFNFEDGCWEPSAIQLPSGEIQLFFANEGLYTTSNDQNISLLRSQDGGLTWTETPEIVSYRAGSRDGMPVPVFLQNGNEIVFAIEDNGDQNFKPYIIRSALENNWSEVAEGNSQNRTYALSDPLQPAIYAGAPYLRQLKTGETILCYQGTEGRNNTMDNAEMKVVIGNNEAKNFNRKTSPFSIPGNKSGLWNSLSVLEDNTVVAITSTNGFSGGNTEVWMIKGKVIPELKVSSNTINIDGEKNEAAWNMPFPVFIGHKSETQSHHSFSYNHEYLYILNNVKDKNVVKDSPKPEENDGITIYVDALNKAYEAPGKGVFSVFVSSDNKVVLKEGENKKWVEREVDNAIKSTSKDVEGGYIQEIAIPWKLLGGMPALDTRIGINISLTEDTGKGTPDFEESIASNDRMKPYTWLSLKLE